MKKAEEESLSNLLQTNNKDQRICRKTSDQFKKNPEEDRWKHEQPRWKKYCSIFRQDEQQFVTGNARKMCSNDLLISLTILAKRYYINISIPAAPLFDMRNSAGLFYFGGAHGVY